ncbi:hypothetical protein F8M41_016822 [Gigaspora margarita]|uniref:Uncharacterized protein n=1 Tax=Gigaspora margarita TaxID=4874 RepID=A0A8H4ANS0_GIGMA|nr:hypothetical protein F8M41_016822 [Gigaspora margarita]
MSTQSTSTLKAFYNDTAIENWTRVNMEKYYRSKSGQKNRRKVLDCIKKDLEEVANLDDFDMARKKKAQHILDDWKTWTGQKNPKRSAAKIENFQVKHTEGTSTRKGEPSSAGMRLREKKKVGYFESPTMTDSSGSEYQDKPKKIKTNKETKISSSSPAGSLSSSQSSITRQTLDLVTDDDEVEQVQMSEEDFNKFTKAFQKLENTKKWGLTSGKPKKGDHLEGWILSCVWLFIDKAFENIEGVEAVRENLVASHHHLEKIREYGCEEVGKLYTGYNGTKILQDRRLKTPKMMMDQFDDLCIHMGSKEKKVRKLETIRFIHDFPYYCSD